MRVNYGRYRFFFLVPLALLTSGCAKESSSDADVSFDCIVWRALAETAIKDKFWTKYYANEMRMVGINGDYIFPEKTEPEIIRVAPEDDARPWLRSINYRKLWHAQNYTPDNLVKLWADDIRISQTGNELIDKHLVEISKSIGPILEQAGIAISFSAPVEANFHIKTFRFSRQDYVFGHRYDFFCLKSGICAFGRRWSEYPDGPIPEKYNWPVEDGNVDRGKPDYFRHKWVFPRDATTFSLEPGFEVEGYALSNSSHEIQRAICYLNLDLPGGVLRQHIAECFTRGLGLFNPITSRYQKTVLGRVANIGDTGKVTYPTPLDLSLLALAYGAKVKRGDSIDELFESSASAGCVVSSPL